MTLGNRMKAYEKQFSQRVLTGLPVIIRIDGKAFHSYTKGLERPYDWELCTAMKEVTKILVDYTSAKIGYTQSDEISLLLYQESYKTQLFMDGKINKINSILAAKTSLEFRTQVLLSNRLPLQREALFDCRTFEVPTKDEAVAYFIWRQRDAIKNSISMAAQSLYSHNELQGKNSDQMQGMIWEKGINWNNYPQHFKRGTFIQRSVQATKFSAEEIEKLPKKHEARTNPDLLVERNVIKTMDMPDLTKLSNRTGFLFNGEEPKVNLDSVRLKERINHVSSTK